MKLALDFWSLECAKANGMRIPIEQAFIATLMRRGGGYGVNECLGMAAEKVHKVMSQ